ncbi:pyridoxal phosphate-dependent transferase [Grimontia hollisae]|uniref:pyridoxal phosphate-dependent transferase n=1 Tax=Grimontia hollisae TaxID=673 RepID=UPI001303356B|nr:pyridoxal phosphate-dependent transferase [Grimontia hollisae]
MMSNIRHKVIGGEQELIFDNLYYGITNSGRSSLRWAIESMGLKKKNILVPDYICQVVIDVLIEKEVKLYFYQVNNDLSIDLDLNALKNIDAVYLVSYFNEQTETLKNALFTLSIPFIIDDVFGISRPSFNNPCHWVYFNSLRKITPIADYSQIISNRELADIVIDDLKSFAQLKYQAKDLKRRYLSSESNDEAPYLSTFITAEHLLDDSSGIYRPSGRSCMLANTFYRSISEETLHRQNNLAVAKQLLPDNLYIDVEPEFPSFLPIFLKKRDMVRKKLMKHNIFLAVHWPHLSIVSNHLSDNILSLPLDSRYTRFDIENICRIIIELAYET